MCTSCIDLKTHCTNKLHVSCLTELQICCRITGFFCFNASVKLRKKISAMSLCFYKNQVIFADALFSYFLVIYIPYLK